MLVSGWVANLKTLAVAVVTVAAVAALAAAGGAFAPQEAVAAGTVTVVVVGPDAATLANETVTLENPTAYATLVRASEQAGFAVTARQFPNGVYVTAIAGHAAAGSAGWVYEVGRGTDFTFPDRAADRVVAVTGDTVRWSWTDAPRGA